MQSGIVVGPFCCHCWLQVLQFSLVPLIDLLSVLLRCSGLTGIQKAAVDQTGSRPPNSDQDLFSDASVALGSALELLLVPAAKLVVTCCHIKSTFWHTSIQLRNGSLMLHRIKEDDTQNDGFFLFAVSSWGTHLTSFFTFPICFKCQMTDHGMVDVEFYSNFSCSCKRISSNDGSQLVVNFRRPATILLTFMALISFAKFLEPPPRYMLVSSS